MTPSEAAARLRAAKTEAERERAREELALAIWHVALRRLQQLPPDEAADVAHDVVLEAVAKIERGDGGATNPDAYVRRMASSRMIDHLRRGTARRHREQSRDDPSAEQSSADEASVLSLPAVDPEALLLEREARDAVKLEAERLRVLLEEAPAAYRQVLEQHYIRGVPIVDLAEREYEARVRDGKVKPDDASEARHRKQARDLIDARLSRARSWLRKRARLADEEEGA
ncbi:MAG: RNA polymerase sigma factor [Myxococcota bacterium]